MFSCWLLMAGSLSLTTLCWTEAQRKYWSCSQCEYSHLKTWPRTSRCLLSLHVHNLFLLSVPWFLISKTQMGIRMLELQGLMCPRLTSSSQHNWKWPWTSDTPSASSQVLGLQVWAPTSRLCCAGEGIQGFVSRRTSTLLS